MGGLYMQSMGVHRTPREYLDAQFSGSTPGMTRSILRSTVVRTRTYYAALEVTVPDRDRQVVGIICLVHYNPRDGEGYVFGYKDMDETMGPYRSECPVAILDLLTPIDSDLARAWRERCRVHAAKRAASPKLRHGDRITLDTPASFTDGTTQQTFTVIVHPARPRVIRLRAANGGWYRISRLEERAFKVERAGT